MAASDVAVSLVPVTGSLAGRPARHTVGVAARQAAPIGRVLGAQPGPPPDRTPSCLELDS